MIAATLRNARVIGCDDPGANVAATISRFKASGHDRCRRRLFVSMTKFGCSVSLI
jgi:hypothetical protein